MNCDWFTLSWLMNNLHWFILLLTITIIILFFFPVLLGFDLKNKAEDIKKKENDQFIYYCIFIVYFFYDLYWPDKLSKKGSKKIK